MSESTFVAIFASRFRLVIKTHGRVSTIILRIRTLCPKGISARTSASCSGRALPFLPPAGPLFRPLWVRSFPLWYALRACCWQCSFPACCWLYSFLFFSCPRAARGRVCVMPASFRTRHCRRASWASPHVWS